jgi:hypothetical protein
MATTSRTKEASSFDVSKYTITDSTKVETIVIEETGDTFDVTIKAISWARKNKLLSENLKWDSDGSTVFQSAEYVRACLREMLIDAPWGKTTESFLISIDSRLGAALEALVPKGFNDEEGDTIETIKKE